MLWRFSVYASKKVGASGKVLSFEPSEENLKQQKENLRTNNSSKNVKLIKRGVWKNMGETFFEENGLGGHISKKGKIKVKLTDLDSELKRQKIPFEKVSFIKMDIEGAEIEAIDGMKELLTRGSPQLAIASYHIRDGEQTYKKVEEKLKKLGYNVETGYKKHLTTWAWKD